MARDAKWKLWKDNNENWHVVNPEGTIVYDGHTHDRCEDALGYLKGCSGEVTSQDQAMMIVALKKSLEKVYQFLGQAPNHNGWPGKLERQSWMEHKADLIAQLRGLGQNTRTQDSPPRTHDLKVHPDPFDDLCAGVKTFELRLNDRDYILGDTLWLREYDPDTGYTGSSIKRKVIHILKGGMYELPLDMVVMSLERADEEVIIDVLGSEVCPS